MTYTLSLLPFERTSLQPHISSDTIDFHYGKHHQAYVMNLNNFLKDNATYAGLSLDEVIKKAHAEQHMPIFNNAAQVWNHTFYWHCMKPRGGGKPADALAEAIDRDFGSFDAFRTEFKQAAVSQFGSGWAWLVLMNGKLSIMKTGNADLPMVHGAKALLTCDVWEHAYYLDYQNRRPDYVDTFLDHLVNWEFAAKNME